MRHAMAVSLALLLSTFAPAVGWADPVVSNVLATQRTGGDRAVDITFDLSGGDAPMTVTVLVSNDNGDTYTVTPRSEFLSGAVGPGIANGTGHAIVWDAMADVPEIYWPQTRVRVVATEEGGTEGIALVITSNVTAEVHQTHNQTLTFTFAEPVVGFDASDVVVVGGTKTTAFSGAGAVYTLLVSGLGGTITVSVPENAAAPANQAATFSNFYQDTWRVTMSGNVQMELLRIPAGTFLMGSPGDEFSRYPDEAQHEVTISRDFYLGKTEVTQQQWGAPLPDLQYPLGNNVPVHNVSWNDVQSWLANLNQGMDGRGTFSLPSEAEWEYACRAGTSSRFHFGDALHPGHNEECEITSSRDSGMWFCGNNSPNGPKAVAQKAANLWGLRDMHGNLQEWCSDRYGAYPAGPVMDPLGSESGSTRVLRGGHWNAFAARNRSAKRIESAQTTRNAFIGFRVRGIK